MQNFIVLGLIPGTNIQLDFGMWLSFSLSAVLAALLVRAGLRHIHKTTGPSSSLDSPEQLSLL